MQSLKVERSKTCGRQLQAAVAAAAGVAASCITRVRGSQHRFEKLKDPSTELKRDLCPCVDTASMY